MSRNADLDRLRGAAILLVLGHHYFASLFNSGWVGVDLFFVLSGFLLGGGLIDRRGSENYFGTFYARRVARIIPLYALLIFTFAAGTWAVGMSQNLWMYATFTQNIYWGLTGAAAPTWVSVTWSLAVEEQFYLALPLIVFLTPSRYLWRVLASLILAAPLIRTFLLLIVGVRSGAAYQLMPCRMDSLFLGVLVAWSIRQPDLIQMVRRNRPTLFTIIAVGALGIVPLVIEGWDNTTPIINLIGYSWIGVFFALIVLAVVAWPSGIKAGPVAWIGERSYSIYLFHMPVALVVGHEIPAVGVTLALCWVLYRYIEQPILSFAHSRFGYSQRQQIAVA